MRNLALLRGVNVGRGNRLANDGSRSMKQTMVTLAAMVVLATTPARAATHEELVEQVRAAETAFAATMAARDHAAFGTFLADEAVFFGGKGPLRGAAAVSAAWQRFFEGEPAPFSWRPETVEVLESGTLALTSGPVFDPEGAQFSVFNSVWRLETDGRWRVVFDRGCPPCEAPAKP